MTDDLRARIAAVIEAHDPCGLPGGIDCSCGQGFRPDSGSWVERGVEANRLWSEHLADAVIRELGMRRDERDGRIVYNGFGQPINVIEPRRRYVTDWESAE